MTTTPEKPRSKRTTLIWGVAGLAVVAVVACLFYFSGRSRPLPTSTGSTAPATSTASESLETVRHSVFTTLARGTDYLVCRTMLEQLNGDLGRLLILKEKANQGGTAGNQRHKNLTLPASLDAKQRDWLLANLLVPDEIAEIDGPRYTRLDSHYLDGCLLFRDVARSLDVDGRPTLERAAAGFNWVMRQVRLQEQGFATLPPPPASFVLRRGYGNVAERARVVLALWRQLDCEGCFVQFARKGDDKNGYFECGVLVEEGGKKQIYLFDPAVGLPLPGPDGKGAATLESVRKQDHLLAAFAVPEALRFETKPTHLWLGGTLSGLAPRAKYLQETILAPDLYVNLAEDPQALQAHFAETLQELGEKDLKVEFQRDDPGRMRRFLPSEEGGTAPPVSFSFDKLPGFASRRLEQTSLPASLPLWQFFDFAQAPWGLFPEPLRDLEWNSEAGRQTRFAFAGFFRTFSVTPRLPQKREQHGEKEATTDDVFSGRGKKTDENYLYSKLIPLDLMLRGQYDQALAQLVPWRELLAQQRSLYENKQPELSTRVNEWTRQANDAYLAVLRAQNSRPAEVDQRRAELARVLNMGQGMWLTLLDGVTAGPRAEEATYLAALCLHEQAVRRQQRLDQAGTQGTEADRSETRRAWKQADDWWVRFLSEAPNSNRASSARLLHAQALHALGDEAQAVQVLQDASGQLTELDRAARSYLVTQLKK